MKRASNPFVALIVMLLVVAACSSEPAASAPASQDAATPSPVVTPTPGEEPSEDDGGPLPSFGSGAGDLAGVVPAQVAGITIQYEHMRGDDPAFLEDMDDEARAFLQRLNASPSDITTAFGFGGNFEEGEIIGVSAFRVAGADETALREEYMAILREDGEFDVEPVPTTIAGKTVYPFGVAAEGEYSALYSRGDTLWIVFGSSQELLEDALSQLP